MNEHESRKAVCDSINLKARFAIMDDGTVLPITTLLDSDGDETDDPEQAVVFVAGTDSWGWFQARVDSFEPVRTT